MKVSDIHIGEKHNNIQIVQDIGFYNHAHWYIVKCVLCGKEFKTKSTHIGEVKSCKECSVKSKIIDLTGQRFGRLVALEYKGRCNNRTLWRCKCDCGNETIVGYSNLVNGNTSSCGCLENENRESNMRKSTLQRLKSVSVEYASVNPVSNHPLRGIWESMLTRCYNPKRKTYKNYGGRGISVCDRWRGCCGFENFINDMGERPSASHTIDRINPNGDYCPENCRWANPIQQANNKTNNVYIIVGEERITAKQFCDILGLNYNTVIKQIKYGLDINIIAKGVDLRTKEYRRNPLLFNGNLIVNDEIKEIILKTEI